MAGSAYRNWRVTWEFKLQDLWVGVYWDSRWAIGHEIDPKKPAKFRVNKWMQRTNVDVYLCLIPCFPIHFKWWLK